MEKQLKPSQTDVSRIYKKRVLVSKLITSSFETEQCLIRQTNNKNKQQKQTNIIISPTDKN